jgi:DNA invertase Pin-like site-specific DNA recombinase
MVAWFNDPAVSGADPIETRPGFSALLDRIENNGVRTVIVEDASRFARDLVAQELGVLMLIKRGMRVLTASGDDMTEATDPSRIMMRQIAGSFAQYEKARRVRKLREARERLGKLGGRKSYAQAKPETVARANALRDERRSWAQISAALFAEGHATGSGKPYVRSAVRAMVG